MSEKSADIIAEFDHCKVAMAEEIEDLQAKVERLERLEDFARWVIRGGNCDQWCDDLDGGDIQDKAEELGLIVPVEVTEPCGDNCACAEWAGFPVTCFRLANNLRGKS
jgi:hypothetical protein